MKILNKHSGNFGELQSAYKQQNGIRLDKSDYNNSIRLIQVGNSMKSIPKVKNSRIVVVVLSRCI